jgi:anti-sigma regulatory factor (Ser/Thr protein kinase)
MCPYDTSSLGDEVVDEARRSHRFIRDEGGQWTSDDYLGTAKLGSPFSTPLPAPPVGSVELIFGAGSLGGVRSRVLEEAMTAGLSEERAGEAVVAVNEVASNSLRHAGGEGVLRMWRTPDAFVCEVSDDGRIEEPLVGRSRPTTETAGGRGLWMVNQLCELVQVRSFEEGTTIRMHIRRGSR